MPGHHLQTGAARLNVSGLSRYQRFFYLNFHGEGWALYAEKLMGELGFLEEPEARLSMLNGQLLRTARVILDIGVHCRRRIPQQYTFYPGQTWTPDVAVEFLQHLGSGPRSARKEVERYLGSPGQAMTYKLGQRTWEAARAACATCVDLKAFHAAALPLGPLGIDDLEREILAVTNQAATAPE